MRIRLKERRTETTDVMSFIFDLGGQRLDYRPGQILHYELDALAFPDERGNRRHFTLSSSPTEEGIVMFTTRMRGSGFKEEHYRRIAYANNRFRKADLPGWKTDRGRTYIQFGPPDELESHPPNREKWLYRHIEGLGDNIIFEFDTSKARTARVLIRRPRFMVTRDPAP